MPPDLRSRGHKNKVVAGRESALFWRLGESFRDFFECEAIKQIGIR